jgi:hypothetical protein
MARLAAHPAPRKPNSSRFQAYKATKHPLCQRKAVGGQEKGLANLWSRKKITKKAHGGRGQESKWEMSVIMFAR